MPERVVEQIVDEPFPDVREEKVEAARLLPQERFQQSIVEEIADILVPIVQEKWKPFSHRGRPVTFKERDVL